jgi:hypothetical protein
MSARADPRGGRPAMVVPTATQQCRYAQGRVLAVLKLQHPSTQFVEGRCFRYGRRQVFKKVVDREAKLLKLEIPGVRGDIAIRALQSARFMPASSPGVSTLAQANAR